MSSKTSIVYTSTDYNGGAPTAFAIDEDHNLVRTTQFKDDGRPDWSSPEIASNNTPSGGGSTTIEAVLHPFIAAVLEMSVALPALRREGVVA